MARFQAEARSPSRKASSGNLDFRLRGDHLPVLRNDLLILRANADLRLLGTVGECRALTGTVGAVDSIFYRDIELLPIGSPFTAPAAARAAEDRRAAKPGSDHSRAVPELGAQRARSAPRMPFLIRGNLATGEITGSIRVGGTLGTPAPNGAVTIKDFRAALPFSTLVVSAPARRLSLRRPASIRSWKSAAPPSRGPIG